MTLDNTRKTWFNVSVNNKFMGGFGDMTEREAMDKAKERYGEDCLIVLTELSSDRVSLLNEKLKKAIQNSGSSL